MKPDDCYANLEVKNTLVTNKIYAKEIILENETFKANSGLLGADVKRLYESQKNTNVLTDDMVSLLKKIETALSFDVNSIKVNSIPIFKLPTSSEIQDFTLQPNDYVMHQSDGKLICRANIDGKTQDYFLKTYIPHVKVLMKVSDDYVNVMLFSSENSML